MYMLTCRRGRVCSSHRVRRWHYFTSCVTGHCCTPACTLTLVILMHVLHRYAEADLSLCRLAGKGNLALELLERPAMEFIDALATTKVCFHGERGICR